MSLLAECLAAHGGEERWRALEKVRLTVDARGLAFASRSQNGALAGVAATVWTREQRVEFEAVDGPGTCGVFTGAVTTVERDGQTMERTQSPSRRLRWRVVDAVAFGGAALWTYVGFPFVLSEDGFEVRERPGRRLHVTLRPPMIAHARVHVLHLGPDGRIARHDYTAEAFGPWARAANVVLEHGEIDGIVTGVRRLVTPRAFGRPLPGPALVRIALSPPAQPGAARRSGS